MAVSGVGYRLVADVLAEVSLHLVETICYTTLTSSVGPGGYGSGGYGRYGYGSGPPQVLLLASNEALYAGALIIIGWGLGTQEIVTVIGIASNGYVYTSAFANAHNPGEVVMAPTFPTQAITDPHFTQSEMLQYIARAQNEMLSDVPVFYQLTQQNLVYGQIFQNTPANCIEVNRVAASTYYCVIDSITILDGEATVVTASPHGLKVGSTIFIQNSKTGFGGCYQLDSVPSQTSLTYPTETADDTAAGGAILYFSRIYETTQTEITMTDRTWRNDYVATPTAWGEDRSGLYRWFVNGRPSSNFPVELLCSVRDDDTLNLLSGFLIPDVLVPTLKYKVLNFAWSKDGVCQDPTRAAWCESRYQKGIMAIRRYLLGMEMNLKGGG